MKVKFHVLKLSSSNKMWLLTYDILILITVKKILKITKIEVIFLQLLPYKSILSPIWLNKLDVSLIYQRFRQLHKLMQNFCHVRIKNTIDVVYLSSIWNKLLDLQ